MKSARRQSREVALQSLYAWQLSGGDALEEMKGNEGYGRSDQALAEAIVRGVREGEDDLKTLIAGHIDRPFERLSPVERAILYIGAFELREHPETPFKVVINEAVELGKSFGAAEGHRFVNGVLEKIAAALRPEEVAKARRGV